MVLTSEVQTWEKEYVKVDNDFKISEKNLIEYKNTIEKEIKQIANVDYVTPIQNKYKNKR